jgi:hypothetical protein
MGKFVKVYSCAFAIGLTLTSAGFASQPISSVTYDITIQDDSGVETRTISVPNGGAVQRLKIVTGLVEIHPPASDKGAVLLKLYIPKDGKPFLAHTATIAEQHEIKVAYSLCDGTVTFHSPKPVHLTMCPQRSLKQP